MIGKLVVTGQEAVEGAGRKMREDLYKKHVSGDPLAARLPYAILTKQIELIGWKRLELNKLVLFQGVTEDSFDSMFRRSLVTSYKVPLSVEAPHVETIRGRTQGGKGVLPFVVLTQLVQHR